MEWLDRCVSGHAECNATGRPGWYPTRLLDLGNPSQCNDQIQLIECGESNIKGAYNTLSHRWGDLPIVQLRQCTLRRFKAGISVDALTQTFRDAVEISRLMGIRYLWIDSLCIIQDSENAIDWRREAALMGLVYSNGYCNLSAASAVTTSDGFFFDRDPLLARYTFKSQYMMFNNIDYMDQLGEAPLHQRAWVLQERLLARRVIHFTATELRWECREDEASELFPRGLSAIYLPQHHHPLKQRMVHCPGQCPGHSDVDICVHNRWDHVMVRYSAAALTYPDDRYDCDFWSGSAFPESAE